MREQCVKRLLHFDQRVGRDFGSNQVFHSYTLNVPLCLLFGGSNYYDVTTKWWFCVVDYLSHQDSAFKVTSPETKLWISFSLPVVCVCILCQHSKHKIGMADGGDEAAARVSSPEHLEEYHRLIELGLDKRVAGKLEEIYRTGKEKLTKSARQSLHPFLLCR